MSSLFNKTYTCKGQDPGVDWCILQSFGYLYKIQKRLYKDDIYITKTTCTTLERHRHILIYNALLSDKNTYVDTFRNALCW
jgi:hypothetical protein